MGIIDRFADRVAERMLEKGAESVRPQNPNFLSMFSSLRDQWGGEKTLINPQEQLSAVYAAVRVKAWNVSQVPFKIYANGTDKEITTGPIIELFDWVNQYMTRTQLWEACETLLNIRGEAPIEMSEERVRGDIPAALYPVHPDKIKPALQNNRTFVGWTVTEGATERLVAPQDMIFIKFYHPRSRLRGLSPLSALRRGLDTEWSAIRYNDEFFRNGNHIGATFSTEQTLSDSQYSRLHHQLYGSRKGIDHAHESLLLDGGLKLDSVRPSNKDLEYLELRKFTREEILMTYGVPKEAVQLYEDINYATATQADRSLWKKTLLPEMRMIQSFFNSQFLHPRGYHGMFDVESIDALNTEVLEKVEAAETLYRIGYPINAINNRLNLGFDEMPWGDDEPAHMRRLEIPEPGETETRAEKQAEWPEPEKSESLPVAASGAEIKEALRAKRWRDVQEKIRPIETEVAKRARDYFFDVEKKILKEMTKSAGDSAVEKRLGEREEFEWIEAYFNDAELRDEMTPYLERAAREGAGSIQTVAREFNMIPSDYIIAQVARRGTKITGINETARKEVLARLRKTLLEQIEIGATEEERAQAIISEFRDVMTNLKRRAKTIARTETHGAFEEGRHDCAAHNGYKIKQWITARDKDVRDPHWDNEHEGPIPMSKLHATGILFPLAPGGTAEDVINCRCTEVYADE